MKRILLMTAGVVFLLGWPGLLPAQTIQVEVNSTAVACPASSSPCDVTFNLADATLPAGTPFTISNASGRTAQVVADDQAATGADTLKMVDTLITATSGFSNNTIVFRRMFNVPPETPPGSTNVENFERQALGQFRRGAGAPVTAQVTVNAKVAGQVIISSTTKTVLCGGNACGNFTLYKGPLSFFDPDNLLIGQHEVKGELTALRLPATGDQLRIDEFKVWSGPGGVGIKKDKAREGLGVTDGCPCPKGVKPDIGDIRPQQVPDVKAKKGKK